MGENVPAAEMQARKIAEKGHNLFNRHQEKIMTSNAADQ